MAKIGLKYLVAAKLNEDGTTYAQGFVVAKAIKANITANSNDVKLYADDIAPYHGVGFYGRVRRNNKDSFLAKWLKKTQFSEPNDETDTKGETVTFQTPTIEGTVFQMSDGSWKEQAEFTDETKAVEWLNKKAGIGA